MNKQLLIALAITLFSTNAAAMDQQPTLPRGQRSLIAEQAKATALERANEIIAQVEAKRAQARTEELTLPEALRVARKKARAKATAEWALKAAIEEERAKAETSALIADADAEAALMQAHTKDIAEQGRAKAVYLATQREIEREKTEIEEALRELQLETITPQKEVLASDDEEEGEYSDEK